MSAETTRTMTIIAVCLMAASAAMAQTKPVLTISFDNDFNAVSPRGVITGSPVGKPVLAPGKVGQALKSGPATGYVEYPTQGVINPAAGTVEMWVCPLDWKADEEKFHVFFDTRGQGALYLYKYYQGVRLLMLTCDNVNGPYFSSSFEIGAWKPGEWHHIAGTWSADGVMCYVDGKPAAKTPSEGALPVSVGNTFRIGDHPWHIERTTSSLIDEVRIYDRALSPAHIAAHSAGIYDFVAPLRPETACLSHELNPDRWEVRVRLSAGGADVEDARLAAKLALVPKGAAFPENAPTLRFANSELVQTLPLTSRQPGEYEVVAHVLLDSKDSFERRSALVIPSTEWQSNRLGLEDKVLPPWTPLMVRGTTVGCWGRDYAFEQAALPTQIVSRGEPLLSRPVSLQLTAGGRRAVWEKQSVRVASHSDTRAQVVGEARGRVGNVEVVLTTRVTAEYDGLLLAELTCQIPDGLTLDGMSLEIPLKRERALYRHRWAPRWEGDSGYVPAGEGVVDKDKFIPYVWLGDNDRGLFWFCESDETWVNGESGNAVEIVRTADAVTLRLNLLAKGQTLPPHWKFVFGLQATPVKPLPKDWRKWRLEPGRKANVAIIWPTPNKDSLRYYGYPEATDPETFAKRVETFHTNGVKAVPYLCLSFISAACPEWAFFRKSWSMGGVDTSSSDVAAYGAGFAMASPSGKGFSDFIIWKNKQFIDRFGIDGLYHDNTHPYASSSLEAGCGYLRDGKARPTYPIMAFRALYRRMYAVVKSLPRETFTMAHMSGKVTIPILAYDDSYLDGEHFRGRVKDSYMDLISLDAFRAEFMGRQWGIMPFFIPEFDAERAKAVEPTRGMMALLMIHDVSPWAIWCNVDVLNEAWAALDEFGYVNADFIPYFDPTPPATTDMPNVYVSAYRRPDGRTLLIIANLSKEDRKGDVRINAQRLGVRLSKVISWTDKQVISTSDRVRLDVPRLGYRMIVVEGTR